MTRAGSETAFHARAGARNGMWSPFAHARGNCVPEFGSRMGCTFQIGPQAEITSRNYASEWDALSGSTFKRKLCPGIEPQTGTRFPLGLSFGKYIPFWASELGRAFRWRSCWESVSRIGEMRRGIMLLSSPYNSTSLSHVGSAVCRMPAVCSFLASIPAERTSFMVKRSRG